MPCAYVLVYPPFGPNQGCLCKTYLRTTTAICATITSFIVSQTRPREHTSAAQVAQPYARHQVGRCYWSPRVGRGPPPSVNATRRPPVQRRSPTLGSTRHEGAHSLTRNSSAPRMSFRMRGYSRYDRLMWGSRGYKVESSSAKSTAK